NFLEITLFPLRAVYEGDVAQFESQQRIGLRKIGNHHLRADARIRHDIRHPRFRPSRIDVRVAIATSTGTDIYAAGSRSLCCFGGCSLRAAAEHHRQGDRGKSKENGNPSRHTKSIITDLTNSQLVRCLGFVKPARLVSDVILDDGAGSLEI